MSIRTVIDFSPLSETTIPCRTLAALVSRSAGGVPVPAAPPSAFSRGALLASQLRLRPARLGALRDPLLGAELRPGLVRPREPSRAGAAPSREDRPPGSPRQQARRLARQRAPQLGSRLLAASAGASAEPPPLLVPRGRRRPPPRRTRGRGAPRPAASRLLRLCSLRLPSYFLSSFSTSIPRSRATVSSLATSRFVLPRRAVFSSSPVAWRKRRLNASSLASISFATSSSSFMLWTSEAFIRTPPPRGSRTGSAPGACARPGAAPRGRGPRGPRPARTSLCPA